MSICLLTMTMVSQYNLLSYTGPAEPNFFFLCFADGGDKDARDMRDMAMERRLRDGEDTGTWTGVAGFEKHTKVCSARANDNDRHANRD